MNVFSAEISQTIWDIKYRYRLQNKIQDQAIEDTWHRVAKAVSLAEKNKERTHWEKEFYQIIENFKFLPGGRILAGAGTQHEVTLFNCFVMNIAEDSIPGIFEALKEGAITLQQGGGVGYDFSVLRPEGADVKKIGTLSSGPISFMRIWDAMCATLLSTGSRRGAMMGILRCDHPDIEQFINAKADANELRHFNVSVLVSDAFIEAVKNNEEWPLIFPADSEDNLSETILSRYSGHREPVPCKIYSFVKARELWEKIIKSAYDYAEPGVIFEDTINRFNNLWYREWISATNPCGEIPLPIYGACNLGSINLTQFVFNPFQENAEFDWVQIENVTRVATRFLDNVVDISHYPLKAQQKEAFDTRRIGLGITGLGDALVMLGISYGSKESLKLADRLMKLISETTWNTSIELAKEKGSFPALQPKKYIQGEFVKTMSPDFSRNILKQGMRNSHHNTIAPAGTISILANNISNGIEPIFSGSYQRNVRMQDDKIEKFNVTDYALNLWRKINKSKEYPPAWQDSGTCSLESHLLMQSILQPHIDNAISKTINLPANFPFEKLSEVYTEAHQLGLKGCTVFRPNPVTGSVLQASDDDVDKCFISC